jgi:adenylosuccinate lyase
MGEYELAALSCVDGRYSAKCDALKEFFSEYGLIRYRVLVETQWLKYLVRIPELKVCLHVSFD